MKIRSLHQSLIILLVATASCLAGPSEPEPRGGNLLLNAGFEVRKAETAEQRLIYAVSPSYRMLRAGSALQSFYVYKDEGDGIAYVGDEENYQRFRDLAAQERYARGFYHAKDLDADLAWRLSEAFGVRHVWTCRERAVVSAK